MNMAAKHRKVRMHVTRLVPQDVTAKYRELRMHVTRLVPQE